MKEIQITIEVEREDNIPITDSFLEEIRCMLNLHLSGRRISVIDSERNQLVIVGYNFNI